MTGANELEALRPGPGPGLGAVIHPPLPEVSPSLTLGVLKMQIQTPPPRPENLHCHTTPRWCESPLTFPKLSYKGQRHQPVPVLAPHRESSRLANLDGSLKTRVAKKRNRKPSFLVVTNDFLTSMFYF